MNSRAPVLTFLTLGACVKQCKGMSFIRRHSLSRPPQEFRIPSAYPNHPPTTYIMVLEHPCPRKGAGRSCFQPLQQAQRVRHAQAFTLTWIGDAKCALNFGFMIYLVTVNSRNNTFCGRCWIFKLAKNECIGTELMDVRIHTRVWMQRERVRGSVSLFDRHPITTHNPSPQQQKKEDIDTRGIHTYTSTAAYHVHILSLYASQQHDYKPHSPPPAPPSFESCFSAK